ncbi:MAG: hypothetical protein KJO40_09525 [Deltaproteobacteria bacterium]|nr:hypothetical protein [Deltaproteobacteria bacterium]NND29023.1 hypothetical protein [Myxococcales bacterium]MBT8463970.1 hypothetical protein [Deltaproteobacteria bacterium]MBT8480084.1 hypothetical protein [Deltaproteobacteria bacterium]NNK07766.1 hypothetical protein [Myxococcales bacterium]
MKPTICRTKQCRAGVPSLRCLAVAATVFAALALASGAFAQEAPRAEEVLEAEAEGPVDEAAVAESPRELAGEVEPVEEAQDDEDWGEFDDWDEEDGADSGGSSGGRAWDFQIGGFVEGLIAPRVVRSSASANEFVASEARFRLNLDATHEVVSARFRGDVFADAVARRIWFDIRDASIFVRGGSWFSMRFGRQVLTWGTGDFLFLNDLFPKDFNSFFIGRADEYLKAPSNSVQTTFMMKKVGLDLIWTPIFEPDRFIDGQRLSFFNPLVGEIIGDRSPLTPIEPLFPDQRLRNGTVHGRLYGTAGVVELAAYGYVGHWMQPNALSLTDPADPSTIAGLTYARLAVYGASLRAPLLGGLFNVEGAFYDSFTDRAGTSPATPNSQFRGLVGYERELFPKFQMGLQYYLEYTLEHDELIARSFWPQYEPHEFRHLITLRLNQLLVMDKLEVSLFVFFSPDELDTYIRPRITYKIAEPLAIAIGANLMFGRDQYTFFGQLQQNTNVYARLRYSF